MGQYSGWADLKDTPDISDPGAIHGHLYDALMCTRKVAVVAILKLEALVTVPAQGKIMKPRTRRGLQTDIECSWLPFSAYASNLL